MGFKDYCKNESKTVNNEEQSKKVEEIYDKFKDKNEDELMSELLNNVAKQKQDGTFNYNSIAETVEKLSPFLNADQKLKIKEILQKIK